MMPRVFVPDCPARHEPRCIIAAETPAQTYPWPSQICQKMVSAKPTTRTQRAASRVGGIRQTRVCAISARMASVTIEDCAGKTRIAEPDQLPTPCESDSEDKTQMPSERTVPAMAAIATTAESDVSYCVAVSPSSSLSSLDELEMPPTPRLRTCQLPMSPSIVTPPLPPVTVSHKQPPPRSPAPAPEVPEFNPFDDQPILRPLAEDWASLDRSSSLSLTAEPTEQEPWPFDNALGLYFDPAMNVTTWDACGFIRSTASSPSPSRFRRSRQRH